MDEENNFKNFDDIENPIIRRALQKRSEEFMFNYNEIFPGSPRRYNDAWKKSTPYDDHRDTYEDTYGDCSTDCMGYV